MVFYYQVEKIEKRLLKRITLKIDPWLNLIRLYKYFRKSEIEIILKVQKKEKGAVLPNDTFQDMHSFKDLFRYFFKVAQDFFYISVHIYLILPK